jgi:hypothetical protein
MSQLGLVSRVSPVHTAVCNCTAAEQRASQPRASDPRARRDLIEYANKFGVDLMAGQHQAIQEALASNHEAILLTYVRRQYDKVATPSPVFAPPELLDDDPQDQDKD